MINFNLKTQLSWHEIAVRAVFVVVTVALIVWFLPRPSEFNYKVEMNAPWRYPDLTASFEFPVYKTDEAMKRELNERWSRFVPYYVYDADVGEYEAELLRQRLERMSGETTRFFRLSVCNSLLSIYQNEIVDSLTWLQDHHIGKVLRKEGRNVQEVSVRQLVTPLQAYKKLMNDPTVKLYADQLSGVNLNDFVRPNMVYDSVLNQTVLDTLLIVAPSSKVVQPGQRIISRGDIVDADTYQVLESYRMEYEERHDSGESGLTLLGKVLYVLIFILLFTVYLGMYRKDYFEKLRSACMLYVLVVAFLLVTSLMVSHSLLHVYLIPFAIVPVFVRVFMDSRTAFMAHVTVVLIAASMLQHPLEFIAVELVSGIAVVFALRELSSRSQLFWAAAIFVATAASTHFSLHLITHGDLSQMDSSEYIFLLFSGIILFCSYPLLYVIEKTFGFVSDITLVELSNTNRELLRSMSEEAPGTFNHSIQVGNLAAEVARRLDANASLVRTGALYHDIGKIPNPIYFTENQSGGISPHEHLSYIESAQYIIGHVTDGLKLADKNHLPRQIRDFIATHHGQGKAKYFYIKYKNEHPDEPVDDLLFTYPGPNPFTKEQAILMMCDAVEAASRSLPDYTEQSIRTLVERIIDGMVQDGFFRECPITFRDIQYAKTVLIEKLKTIYHTRISYPEANQ